jgi:hypothetical protein
MIRLLARAVLVAAVAGVALTQLQGEQQFLAWELVLVALVIWQIRALPSARFLQDRPLFDFPAREPAHLPRVVSTAELSVIDALSGHLGPDRRLQPALRRIAAQRLRRVGVDLASPTAVDALGEETWAWLNQTSGEAPDVETLEAVVSRLERL